MKKEQYISLARHVLSGIAGVMIAKGIVNESTALSVVGTLMTLGTIIWSIFDKTFEVNKLEGAVRQLLTTLGLFVAFINPGVIEEIIGFGTGILAIVLGQTSKVKTVDEGSENK